MNFIFFHLLRVLPLLVVHVVLVKIFTRLVGDVRSIDTPLFEEVPLKADEPRVSLHLFVSVVAYAARCFARQAFVYKVRGLHRPVIRYFIFLD